MHCPAKFSKTLQKLGLVLKLAVRVDFSCVSRRKNQLLNQTLVLPVGVLEVLYWEIPTLCSLAILTSAPTAIVPVVTADLPWQTSLGSPEWQTSPSQIPSCAGHRHSGSDAKKPIQPRSMHWHS